MLRRPGGPRERELSELIWYETEVALSGLYRSEGLRETLAWLAGMSRGLELAEEGGGVTEVVAMDAAEEGCRFLVVVRDLKAASSEEEDSLVRGVRGSGSTPDGDIGQSDLE